MLELKVIKSTLENQDVDVLFDPHVPDFLVSTKEIWDYIKDYYAKYRAIPSVNKVAEKWPGIANEAVDGPTKAYVDDLREDYIRERTNRILLKGAEKLTETNSPDALQQIQNQLAKLSKYSDTFNDTNIMDLDAAEERYNKVREEIIKNGGTLGIPFGIEPLDAAYTRGMSPGDMIVLLGFSGRGKSFFSTYLACHAYSMGYKVMIVSLEMQASTIQDRVLTIMGSGLFSNSGLSVGDITTEAMNEFRSKVKTDQPFVIVESDGRSPMNMNTLQPKINRYQPDLLIIDYLQLFDSNNGDTDMVTKMRNIADEVKRGAVANEIPIIGISSATPNGPIGDMPPELEAVAYSKAVAYNADLALSVHRSDLGDKISVATKKNRHGPWASFDMIWDLDTGIIKKTY